MKWIALVSLICFLFVGLPSFTACDTSISSERRAYYLELAEEYEDEAISAQNASEQRWFWYCLGKSGQMDYSESQLREFKQESQYYARRAKEYRELASYYRALAKQ